MATLCAPVGDTIPAPTPSGYPPASLTRLLHETLTRQCGPGMKCLFGAECDSAPNKHFIPGPHCRVSVSWRRRVSDAGGYPLGVGAGIVSPTGAHKVAIALSGPDDHLV